MKGIAVFYKPKKWSSYDMIRFLKRELQEEKIGHGGTLDPIAEGVLIIGIGKTGTKMLTEILKGKDKEYTATIVLGQESDTYDMEGKVIDLEIKDFPSVKEIKQALDSFLGKTLQTPPRFSAVKVKGKPAYSLARKGLELDLKPKEVMVSEIELLSCQKSTEDCPPLVRVRMVVGSGFYVRSFADDLGKILKTGGVLKELKRTRVGQFRIEEAITIDDFKKDNLELYFKAHGLVQGIFFRDFAQKRANSLDITGKAENLDDGGIEIIAQGKEKNLQEFLDKILEGPKFAKVEEPFYYFRKPQENYLDFEKY